MITAITDIITESPHHKLHHRVLIIIGKLGQSLLTEEDIRATASRGFREPALTSQWVIVILLLPLIYIVYIVTITHCDNWQHVNISQTRKDM